MFKKVAVYFEDGNVKNFKCDTLFFSHRHLLLLDHSSLGEELIERDGMKKLLITFYSDEENKDGEEKKDG